MDGDELLDFLTEPSTFSYVRVILRHARIRGWAFEQAWAHALRTLPRGIDVIEQDRAVLKETKAAYRASYTGESLTALDGVLSIAA